MDTQVKTLERIIKKHSKDPVLRKMVGNRAILEQIILNNAINKYHAKDLLIGKTEYFENANDYIKRAAGPVAMGITEGSRIEPLMLKDEKFKNRVLQIMDEEIIMRFEKKEGSASNFYNIDTEED